MPERFPSARWTILRLLVAARVALIAPAALAQPPNSPAPRIERVRVGLGGEARGLVKVGTWTPVRVNVRPGTAPFRGRLELSAPDDAGTPVVTPVPLDVAADRPGAVEGFVRPGTRAATVSAQLFDEKGRRLGRPFEVAPSQPIGWETTVVLTAGKASGLDEVPKLAKFQGTDAKSPGLVVAALGELPDNPLALEGVSAIALATDEVAALASLGDGDVLRRWVAQGGHLVVSLGAEWRRAAEVLGDLLPAEPTGPTPLSDPGTIESFTGSSARPLRPPITVIGVRDWERRGGVPLAATASTPLIVRAPYGFGRVTLTGLDVATPRFADWADRRSFWDRLLDIRGRDPSSELAVGGARGALIQSADPDLSARLHEALGTFPGIAAIAFGWVAFFVFVYIAMIGPLDYFFVRRVARRMQWTWVTFPLIVAATVVAAFASAGALKGRTLRVNKVDLLDVDQARGTLRGATWLTVYSPGNLDYTARIRPLGPTLDPRRSDAAIAGTTLSWSGPPEPGLSDLGRVLPGTRPLRYPDAGRLDELDRVRIPIWSARSFQARWAGSAPGAAIVEADLRTVAGDRADGSIRNLLDVPMRHAQLFYGRNVYDLGTIRPRGIARVNATRSEATTRVLGRIADAAARGRDTAGRSPEAARQARLDPLRAALFHDAMGTRGEGHPSLTLRWLDLSSQVVESRRPMLVAEVDVPASALDLKGGTTAPEPAQATLIRVILSIDGDSRTAGASAPMATEPRKVPSPLVGEG
jgi:hypothetical protein